MNKTILSSIIISAAAMSLASCSDFLDTTPTDKVSDLTVWSKYEYAQLHANYMYEDLNLISGYGDGSGCTRDCWIGLTEALTPLFKYGGYNYSSLNRLPSEMSYGSAITLSRSYVDSYLGNWGTLYGYIATANQAIANLRQFGTFDEDKKAEIEAEFRFFRAYYYATLAKRYPTLILYTENLNEYQKDKEPVDVSVIYDFIYEDLKFAGEHLPVSTTPNGRLTSGTAYAVMSRVMLYAERWDKAIEGAEKVLGMGYTMGYSDLQTPFTEGGEGAIFQICFSIEAERTHSMDSYYAPGGDKAAYDNPLSGGYGCPTQEMVESFELASGGFPDWSAWHTEEGTLETPPYALLEPRFANTVLYNGATWKEDSRVINTTVIGKSEKRNEGFMEWTSDDLCNGRTTTGYYLRKLLDENFRYENNGKSTKPYTFIRLAEVYLNYAEALFHANRSTDAVPALNAVRTRQAVGLPAASGLSGDRIMEAIRQERKVELAYEGHYYWDMRRWKLAEEAFTGVRAHGLKITDTADGLHYQWVSVDDQDRNFPAKMYYCPIPQSELDNNKNITQISVWQ